MIKKNTFSRYRLGLIVFSLFFVASCGFNKGAQKIVINEGDQNELLPGELMLLWERDVGEMTPHLRPTFTKENQFCTISSSGEVFITNLNGDSIGESFSFPNESGNTFLAGAGCSHNIVSAARSDGVLYAYDVQTQERLWVKNLKTRIFGSPLLIQGKLFVVGLDGRLYAFGAKQGREIWRYVSPVDTFLRAPLESTVVEDESILYVGINNGILVALRSDSGRILWENSVAIPTGKNLVGNILDVTTPTVKGNLVCASAYGAAITCFDKKSGEYVWDYSLPIVTRVAFDHLGKRIFATDLEGTVYAFEASNGNLLWRQKSKIENLTAPAFVSGAVIVGDGEGYLHAYYADTGESAYRLRVNDSPLINLEALPKEKADVYGLTLDGVLFRAQFRI